MSTTRSVTGGWRPETTHHKRTRSETHENRYPKAALIDRLIGREVVPTGDYTKAVVSVVGSPDERVEARFADGRSIRLDHIPWRWGDLPMNHDPSEALSGVRVFVDDSFLRAHDL